MLSSSDLVRRFRALYLPGNPDSYARMNKPGAISKYTKILDPRTKRPVPISDAAIVEHLLGRATYAAPLIGADGFTREAALDIDAGGEEAVKVGLRIVSDLGITAYGLVSPACSGGHNGGHIRIPFAGIAAPERAHLLGEQIQAVLIEQLHLTAKDIEVYPMRKSLRLPFGRHTWTGKRGALLLQDGTVLDLDRGEPLVTIEQAITLVEAAYPNDLNRLPLPVPKPIYNAPVVSPNAHKRANITSPIQDYIQSTNLLDWLVSIGARIVYRTSRGGYLVSCPCGYHTNHDAHPSLEVQPARNPRHGAYVLIGHAIGCVFATEPGSIVNAFDAFCRWYGLETQEAIRQLYP